MRQNVLPPSSISLAINHLTNSALTGQVTNRIHTNTKKNLKSSDISGTYFQSRLPISFILFAKLSLYSYNVLFGQSLAVFSDLSGKSQNAIHNFLRSSMETKCISRGKNAAPISFKLHRIVPLTTTTYQIFHTFLTYPQFSIITQIILLRMKTLLDFLCVIFEGFSKSSSYSVKLYYFHLVMKIH